MIWTNQLNEFIVRAYYRVTDLERNPSGYRHRLHDAFITRFPELSHVPEQNVVNQYRVIVNNNRVALPTRQQIFQEVSLELGLESSNYRTSQRSNPSTPPVRHSMNPVVRKSLVTGDVDPIYNEALTAFQVAFTEYAEILPDARPRIPKLKFTSATTNIIAAVDRILADRLASEITATEVHSLIYVAAATVIRLHNQHLSANNRGMRRGTLPFWVFRLNKRIEKLRKEIGRVTQALLGNPSPRVHRCVANIIGNYHLSNDMPIEEILEVLKQKLAVCSNRIRRYQKSFQRRTDNTLFFQNQRGFYKNLINSGRESNLNLDQAEDFWRSVWSESSRCNLEAAWLPHLMRSCEALPEMIMPDVTEVDVKAVLDKAGNWKAPGVDKIHNFWLKRFKSTHRILANQFNQMIADPDLVPPFFTKGITFLIPKEQGASCPSKCRPITCLPTIYKVFTSVLCANISKHLDVHKLIAEEQKGCAKGSRGCKEQLIIDTVAVKQAVHQKRNISTAYIDYKSAFDSISHSWLLQVLRLYKINPNVVLLLRTVMKNWSTKLSVSSQTSGEIPIRRGIFQGDSLSPLWFCLALNPLSHLLHESKYGFQVKHGILSKCTLSHLMYIDDIKLYAKDENQLRSLLDITIHFSRDIGMQLGLEKCRIKTIVRGKHTDNEGYSQNNIRIEGMDSDDVYKYLGILQATTPAVAIMKSKLLGEFERRLDLVLKTELYGKNKIMAINTFAIPVLLYTFGVIQWSNTDLESVNRRVRVVLANNNMHNRAAEKLRITIPRHQGGRGVLDLKTLHYNKCILFVSFSMRNNPLAKYIRLPSWQIINYLL
ncbi:unnamed protein product [Hermetia illucens]|uniref:Reverse transcriptase domain-containing protein n=1 Tax=Hermetia illucens TaxID=343691 RepID=A0A7R8UEG3_HERIL|nr:unnamed protein product [Hermetia illucens]